MKKLLIFICFALFAAGLSAQNRIPGPAKVIKGTKYIDLDVSDTSMIDLNNHVKLMQKGDTLLILSRNHIIGKISQSQAWFSGTGSKANIGDTLTFSTGSQIRRGTNSIEFFPYNTGGHTVQVWWQGNYIVINTSRMNLNNSDTTLNRYAGNIAFDGHKYYGFADNRWINFAGGGGSGTLSIANSQIAVGSGTNVAGGSSSFLYTGSTRTPWAFYTGDNNPNSSTSKLNWAGPLYVYRLFATANSEDGVTGTSTSGTGVYGVSNSGLAGKFDIASANTGNITDFQKNHVTVASITNLGGLYISDSLRAKYAHTSNKTRWAGWSHRSALYSDSTSTSSFALRMIIQTANAMLADTLDKEIAWYFTDDLGAVQKTYKLDELSPGKQIQALMAGIEVNRRLIATLENDFTTLSHWVIILSLTVVILIAACVVILNRLR